MFKVLIADDDFEVFVIPDERCVPQSHGARRAPGHGAAIATALVPSDGTRPRRHPRTGSVTSGWPPI